MTTTTVEPVTVFDCAWCEDTVTKVPVRDAIEVSWVGLHKARAWCSQDCLDNHSEAAHEGRA